MLRKTYLAQINHVAEVRSERIKDMEGVHCVNFAAMHQITIGQRIAPIKARYTVIDAIATVITLGEIALPTEMM